MDEATSRSWWVSPEWMRSWAIRIVNHWNEIYPDGWGGTISTDVVEVIPLTLCGVLWLAFPRS